jgi:hypothetical protein
MGIGMPSGGAFAGSGPEARRDLSDWLPTLQAFVFTKVDWS